MTVAFGLWWTGWHSKPAPPWLLIPCRESLDKSKVIEINGDEIKDYNRMDYWLAIRFWKHYKKFGIKEWQRMTPQQIGLITLFDDLADARRK